MKKSLLALSILGAFSGVAQAQTNVTMYGVVDAGIVRIDDGKAKTTKLDSGIYSGSRLGFKGTEDLGGGLNALFVLETGLNVDTGGFAQSNTPFGRQTFVGLNGGFGTVKLGRQTTFSYVSQAAIDPFGIGLAGDSTKFFAGALRINNTIRYESPNLSGFTAQFSHSFGEVVGKSSDGSNNAIAAQYTNGPIFISTFYDVSNNVTSAVPLVTSNKTKIANIGGTYDFGVVKTHLMYDRVKDDNNKNQRDLLVGATVPFGASSFLVDYIKHTDKGTTSSDAKQYAIGYTYSMSKRTTLYTSYSRTSNDAGAAFGGISGVPANAGLSYKNFDVGVRHTF